MDNLYKKALTAFSEDKAVSKTIRSKKIYDFIESFNFKGRDKRVIDTINNYYANNTNALADGLREDFIVFGNTNRNRFYDAYKVDDSNWKKFTKDNKKIIKNKTFDDFLYPLLFTSYLDTGNRLFLEMLMIVEIGSKFKKYFKYGVTNSDKMSYVLEHLSGKYLIKKSGSLYLACQEQLTTILESKADNLKIAFSQPKDDGNFQYIVNRISTSINDLMKGISREFYKTSDSVIYNQSELNLSGDDTGRMSLVNNSVMVDNYLNLLSNYNPTALDFSLLNTLRIKSKMKKFIMKKIFLDRNKKYLYRINKIYVDIISDDKGDWEYLKKNYHSKAINGRLVSDDIKNIDFELEEDIRAYLIEYQKVYNTDDVEDLSSAAGIVDFVRLNRMYAVLKGRQLMNEVRG